MDNIRSAYTTSIGFFGLEDPLELAQRFGSPLYVYNEKILRQRCRDLLSLSDHPGFRVNYSAKANANPALLSIIRAEGCLVDAMSPAELHMNRLAGFPSQDILYVSNNISRAEMRHALSRNLLLSVDSLAQLEQLGELNRGGAVMIRFNPGIGVGHSQKVITGGRDTKFGVNLEDLEQACRLLDKYELCLEGVNQHIGSLFMDGSSYVEAMQVLLDLAASLLRQPVGKRLRIIDFGGGFGIPYHKYAGEPRLDLDELGRLLDEKIGGWSMDNQYAGQFLIEPGRYIAAECGLLLGSVHATKSNGSSRYVGTDLGFSVMVRPMLYEAFHDIEIYRQGGAPEPDIIEQTIVGNICESGDIIAKRRLLPEIKQGDVIALLDAGAYGYAMASNYNQRFRPAEVLIETNGTARLIRRREDIDDLARNLVLS